jgi:SAM-dependent methyltransferase
MTFDPRWDAVHRERQWGTVPNEHFVRFIARSYPNGDDLRALDLGCGAGAQSLFLSREGFDVSGIDGSQAAIDRCAERAWIANVPSLRPPGFQVADVTTVPFPDAEFDLVVDVATMQCLDHDQAILALNEVVRILKPGGLFFSYTSRDGTSPDVHRGLPVRSSSIVGIAALYGTRFEIVNRDEEQHTEKNGTVIVRHWIIVARKAH